MSVTVPLGGAIGQPTSTLLTTTSQTDVFTASDKYPQDVVSIIIVNEDASARVVTIEWNNGSTDRKIWRESVAANTTIKNALDAPIRLYSKSATQKIKATAAAGNVVTVTVVAVNSIPTQSGNDPSRPGFGR